jgi:secreted Zn-dependent insulinase-like peptidase
MSFTETVSNTTLDLLSNLKNLKINFDEFQLIRDEMNNQIKEQTNLVPALRGYVNFFRIVLRDFVDYNSIIETIDNLKLDEFRIFCLNLFNSVYLKIFIHGTLNKENSIKLAEDIKTYFKKSNSISPNAKDYINKHADLSGYFIFREQLNQSYNVNHAVLNFYQIGQESIQNIINANMVKALCGGIYYTELRVKEQLGYIAKGKVFSEGNVIYYLIKVQGSHKTPDFMDLRIENLLSLMRKKIENTDEKMFEKYKILVSKKISKKDKNIKKRSLR